PDHALVRSLLTARQLARLARTGDPRPLRHDAIESFYNRLVADLDDERYVPNDLWPLLRTLKAELGDVTSDAGSYDDESWHASSNDPPLTPSLLKLLERLHEQATWKDGKPCDEPLYQAEPRPRRYPLATLISRRYRRRFDLLIADEAHEYNHDRSAQTRALHRLVSLPGVVTLTLTGSLMGGYASALFPNAWATNRDFRNDFERWEKRLFIQRYGYQKLFIAEPKNDRPGRRGRVTDREEQVRKIGEAPGVHPAYITRYLLPSTVILHKSDLDLELPPIIEEPFALEAETDLDHRLLAEYNRLQIVLLEAIKRDRFIPDLAGKLLGALVELPSYLDRATDDLDPFILAYPAQGEDVPDLIDVGRQFPASYRTPKERFLLQQLRRRLENGENVAVFLRHTGTAKLPKRIMKLIQADVTRRVTWLDATRVPTHKREAWIRRNVIDAGTRVLIVNPNAVRTGLNCLTRFSAAIWHQLDYAATTYRQANGRFHRIGQDRPVWVATPYLKDTAQEIAFQLVAAKLSASLQVDGLDLQASLEAAGASDEESSAREAAMSLGEAIYQRLVG
ncbi:MAG: hypothetical protein D6773_02050, partial [Alphaproteobacteria bacterium]